MNRMRSERQRGTGLTWAWRANWLSPVSGDVLAARKSLRYTRNQATPMSVALGDRGSNGPVASTVRRLERVSCDWGWVDV